MTYAVIYRTVTHVAHRLFDTEDAARQDEHLSDRWMGRLYSIADADGFDAAEAKELYSTDELAPAWGVARIDLD
jgi:hypothetical protein